MADEQAQGQLTVQEQTSQESSVQESSQDERTFTQKDLDKIAGNRAKEAEQRAINRILKKANADSVDALIEGYTDVQRVADELKSEELKDVEGRFKAAKEQAERYEGALKKLLELQREGIPDHIGALLDRMDIVDQFEWLAENRAALVNKGPSDAPDASRQQGVSEDVGFGPARLRAAYSK